MQSSSHVLVRQALIAAHLPITVSQVLLALDIAYQTRSEA